MVVLNGESSCWGWQRRTPETRDTGAPLPRTRKHQDQQHLMALWDSTDGQIHHGKYRILHFSRSGTSKSSIEYNSLIYFPKGVKTSLTPQAGARTRALTHCSPATNLILLYSSSLLNYFFYIQVFGQSVLTAYSSMEWLINIESWNGILGISKFILGQVVTLRRWWPAATGCGGAPVPLIPSKIYHFSLKTKAGTIPQCCIHPKKKKKARTEQAVIPMKSHNGIKWEISLKSIYTKYVKTVTETPHGQINPGLSQDLERSFQCRYLKQPKNWGVQTWVGHCFLAPSVWILDSKYRHKLHSSCGKVFPVCFSHTKTGFAEKTEGLKLSK